MASPSISTNGTNSSITTSFTDPSTLSPLFTAQQIVCAYQISDVYATSPRHLFYALLAATFLFHRISWLANVFLGVAATYAGTAAIEAFILLAAPQSWGDPANVSLPLVPSTLPSNLSSLTPQSLTALVTDQDYVNVQPASLNLDLDPILGICVTSYLVLLPMQCWSRVVRVNRARHILITLWNILMLAGALCALILWPTLYDAPTQYRFCYPTLPDATSLNNDVFPTDLWTGDWNSTVWNLFSNFSNVLILNDNCFYPCFNTSQIIRSSTTLTATLYTNTTTPRLDSDDLDQRSAWISNLPDLVYVIIPLVGSMQLFLLFWTWFQPVTRIPVGEPMQLWRERKSILHSFWIEIKMAARNLRWAMHHPRTASDHWLYELNNAQRARSLLRIGRFALDLLILKVLLASMLVAPLVIIGFIVWIEWYIVNDHYSGESPQQVGQWTTSVSVALVLISAAILRLKHTIASKEELEREVDHHHEALKKLEERLAKMEARTKATKTRTSSTEAEAEDTEFKFDPGLPGYPKSE